MLKEGQVLWLKIRYNNRPGDVADREHPYIVYSIDEQFSTVELIQCDSLEGKPHKVLFRENTLLRADGETVFSKDGYAQLDNCIMVELSPDLENFRRTEDTMTTDAFFEIKRKYELYQMQNQISENKNVYMSISELLRLNR